MRSGHLILLLSGLLVPCIGCWKPPAPTARQLDRGLIWMFPGVEGGPWALKPAHDALRDAGVDAAIQMHDWQRPFGAIANLVDRPRNLRDAAAIAQSIVRYRDEHPDAPIDLIGYSGGGGVAVMVGEALPREVRLRNVVLAQPALSPDYDLAVLLERLDGKFVNYYSPLDVLILGAGTTIFGTMDRSFVPSAGKDGFRVENTVKDEQARQRVEQHAWSGRMAATGHYGGHLGILLYKWNKRFVAPYVTCDEQDSDEPAAAAVSPSRGLNATMVGGR